MGARRALPLLLALVAAGCGTTQIITTEPTARIFVDGRAIGRGQAEIDKRGTPATAQVVIQTEDGRRERQLIHRRFTGTTFLFGLFTYGVCLIACWEYPDAVFIPLPAPRAVLHPGEGDPWLSPPPGWHAGNSPVDPVDATD